MGPSQNNQKPESNAPRHNQKPESNTPQNNQAKQNNVSPPHQSKQNVNQTSEAKSPPNAQKKPSPKPPPKPSPKPQQRQKRKNKGIMGLLENFLPEAVYNRESKRIFGILSAEDLLLIALIFLFSDSGDEDTNLISLALLYVLLSDYIDLSDYL